MFGFNGKHREEKGVEADTFTTLLSKEKPVKISSRAEKKTAPRNHGWG